MQFVVESTGVTDRLAVLISSPESCSGRRTVSAAGTSPPSRRLKVIINIKKLIYGHYTTYYDTKRRDKLRGFRQATDSLL